MVPSVPETATTLVLPDGSRNDVRFVHGPPCAIGRNVHEYPLSNEMPDLLGPEPTQIMAPAALIASPHNEPATLVLKPSDVTFELIGTTIGSTKTYESSVSPNATNPPVFGTTTLRIGKLGVATSDSTHVTPSSTEMATLGAPNPNLPVVMALAFTASYTTSK
jgi:hypothetical protein